MFKKIGLSLLLVAFVVLGFAGTALAADEAAVGVLGVRLAFGEIIQISARTFTVETQQGAVNKYHVDENSRYLSNIVEDPTFESMRVGDLVGVAARLASPGQGYGNLLAKVVVILPPNFDPSIRFGVRVRGEVLAVDPDAGEFSVVKPNGDEIEFQVDEHTRFWGQSQELGDLEPGWGIAVVGGCQDDGTYLASIVATAEHPLREYKHGSVKAIYIGRDAFSIEKRQGESETILVDENTVYHGWGGTINGLADLEKGMVVGAVVSHTAEGDHMARRVLVANPENLPDFEVKAAGRVTGIRVDSFTIQNPGGNDYTFLVDELTRFRDLEGTAYRFADLREGLPILVGGETIESGELVARLVIGR